jgi:hypothetical protein
MIKQLVRGYVYFEDKKIEDVKKVFENFKFDEVKFKFFEKIKINNEEILKPGVFLNGHINEKYTSENIVRLFRKLMGLNIEKKNCDISVEREDEIEELDKERPFVNYIALQFKKTEIKEFVKRFKKKTGEEVLYKIRDVGYKEGFLLSFLEIFSNTNIDEKINNVLFEEKIDCKKVVKI